MLHQASDRRHRHVGSERGDDEQVDFIGRDVAPLQATLCRRHGHVAGGQLGGQNPPLANAGPLENPIGVAAERGQIFVRDDGTGDVASRGQDLHAHEPAHRGRVTSSDHRWRQNSPLERLAARPIDRF